jgi:hypothetical protein
LANRLSARTDVAARTAPETAQGAFFVSYRNSDLENLVAGFQTALLAANLRLEQSAVLCRGRALADKLVCNEGAPGQGAVKKLAQAAILRDRHQDYRAAFKLVVAAIVGLLSDPPRALVARISQPDRSSDDRNLRRLIWAFTRNADSGLPAAMLLANTQWHPQMLEEVQRLLARITQDHGLASISNLGNKLARRSLPSAPLVPVVDLTANALPRIRVDTVHQAKGESLDAVLYLAANKEHASSLLAGVGTELGRIGYVAVTRARNLLWLGIPATSLDELRPSLLARGFRDAANRTQA